MDAEETRAERIKSDRGDLLGALRMAAPCEFSYGSLLRVLYDVAEKHVRIDLDCMIEAKYVRWTNEKPRRPWRDRRYKLTKAGNDLANGITHDPSVEM